MHQEHCIFLSNSWKEKIIWHIFFFKIIEVSIYSVKKTGGPTGGYSVKWSEILQNGIQNQKNGDGNYHLIGLTNIPAETEPTICSWVMNGVKFQSE